jgi:septum formation protein
VTASNTPAERADRETPRLILASASPRRLELLGRLGVDFDVTASAVDEDSVRAARPETLARRLARLKALDVAGVAPEAVVLAADTVVVLGGQLLAKPGDRRAAQSMLEMLRGRRHRVITGVALVRPEARTRAEHVVTRVRMRRYGDDEIEASIERGDPFDKAGAYAIQDPALHPVESYEGCYCNVVGLPLWTAVALLRDAGLTPRTDGLPSVCGTCPLREAAG